MSPVLVLAVTLAFAQPGSLRILVIEGEDAVNVIQQKTAVRPVVEVRDRNNLPVAGALVTFSVEGGSAASFGGASTLTVATNAAGQAAVTSLTPSAAGAFQIQVQAAFQGQLATATIAQTNVMTAAQAAAASATASGSGSAGGAAGGGGLSATTLGIAGAAVAGGAVAATQLTQKEESAQTFAGRFSGPLTSTIVSRGGTCVITRTIDATMTIVLESTEPIRGYADIEGTDTVVGGTCPADVTGRERQRIEDVSGTPAAFGFRFTRTTSMPDPIDGGSIDSTVVFVLQAALAGDVITGVLKRDGTSSKSGPNPATESSTATFQISLRKTP